MSDFEQITTEVQDNVLTITLNRPDRLNAWTADDGPRADARRSTSPTPTTRCARSSSPAPGAASAPAPTWARAATRSTTASAQHDGPAPRDNGGELTLRVFDSTKPVIAAINGPAVGVGATMTLPMDIRLAADDARIGFVFARRGIIPEACSSWFLPRVVGISRAMEWVATGRVFSAQEALEGGLVRSLHPAASCSTRPARWRGRSRRTPRRCRSRSPAG